MEPINIASALVLLVVVIVLGMILAKTDKKENYCVDISGGFKSSCDCSGYCEKF
jgi:hypothetical protein